MPTIQFRPWEASDMTGKHRPSPPSDLESRGRALWREIVADHYLDGPGREVLAEACRVADLCDRLRVQVDAAGTVDRGSMGQERITSAVGELRRQRHQLAQLLAQLD